MANHQVAFPTCGGCIDVEVDGLVLVDVGVIFTQAGAKVVGLLQYGGLDVGVSELVLNFLEHFLRRRALGLFRIVGGEGFSVIGYAVAPADLVGYSVSVISQG